MICCVELAHYPKSSSQAIKSSKILEKGHFESYLTFIANGSKVPFRSKHFSKLILEMETIMKGLDLKLFRIKKGIKQKELAKQAGISASTLCLIESGRINPRPEELDRLKMALPGFRDLE
jgi:DNA-binding transcriptional regulator YiaG